MFKLIRLALLVIPIIRGLIMLKREFKTLRN